MKEIDLTIRN